jgi:hypothetical protein
VRFDDGFDHLHGETPVGSCVMSAPRNEAGAIILPKAVTGRSGERSFAKIARGSTCEP